MPRNDLYANIKHARYDKKRLADLNISPEAQDLLTKILQPNPLTRYSASECLKHPWITGMPLYRLFYHYIDKTLFPDLTVTPHTIILTLIPDLILTPHVLKFTFLFNY